MSSSVSNLIKRYEKLKHAMGNNNNHKPCEVYSEVKMKDIITQFENNLYFDDEKRKEFDGSSVLLRFTKRPTSVEEARASALKEQKRYISEIRASQQEFELDDEIEYVQFIDKQLVWCKGTDNISKDLINSQEPQATTREENCNLLYYDEVYENAPSNQYLQHPTNEEDKYLLQSDNNNEEDYDEDFYANTFYDLFAIKETKDLIHSDNYDIKDYNGVVYENYDLLVHHKDDSAEVVDDEDNSAQAVWCDSQRRSDIEVDFNFLEVEDDVVSAQDKFNVDENSAVTQKIETDRKAHIVHELIDTEQKYIANLNLTIRNYKYYLDQRISDSTTIFCNLPELLMESQQFLAKLYDERFDYDRIGRVFLEQNQLFNLYPQYARKQHESNKLILEHKELIEERQASLNDRLGLKSHLLKPIQRITKYKLLLEQLEKELISGGLPSSNVTKAIKSVTYYIQKTNDSVLVASINNNPFYNTDPGDLIFQSNPEDYKLLSPCRLDIMLFLFQKCIILAEKEALTKDFIFKYRIHVEYLTRIYKEEKLKFHLIDFQNPQHKYVLKANTIEAFEKCRNIIDTMLMEQFQKEKEKRNSIQICDRNSDEIDAAGVMMEDEGISRIEHTNGIPLSESPILAIEAESNQNNRGRKSLKDKNSFRSKLEKVRERDKSEPKSSSKESNSRAKSPMKKKKESKFDFGVFGNISNLNALLMK